MKKRDYYQYWGKVSTKSELCHREIICLRMLKKFNNRKLKFLDLGCGDGSFLEYLKKETQFQLVGVDSSKLQIKKCNSKNLKVIRADIEIDLPFEDNSFDIVYSGEVIEHLYNPDFFLQEVKRILKPKGYLLLSTPNLCSWYNRILFFCGIKPIFMEISAKSKSVGSGFLKRFIKDPHPVGHIKIFNYDALNDLLRMYSFKVLQTKGAIFSTGFPDKLKFLDKLFTIYPKLSSDIVLLAQKVYK